VPSHPSDIEPQVFPSAAQEVGVHGTQWLFVHSSPEGQGPQSSAPPQPSLAVPQVSPSEAQVALVQVWHW
jgi:hypothetical protein